MTKTIHIISTTNSANTEELGQYSLTSANTSLIGRVLDSWPNVSVLVEFVLRAEMTLDQKLFNKIVIKKSRIVPVTALSLLYCLRSSF